MPSIDHVPPMLKKNTCLTYTFITILYGVELNWYHDKLYDLTQFMTV